MRHADDLAHKARGRRPLHKTLVIQVLFPHSREMETRPPVVDLRHLEVSVIGLGLIGGSIVRALPRCRGWDTHAPTRESAAELGYAVTSSLEDALAQKDIVVVATTQDACARTILDALEKSPQATVMDVGSVKDPILQEVLRAPGADASRYVPAHP